MEEGVFCRLPPVKIRLPPFFSMTNGADDFDVDSGAICCKARTAPSASETGFVLLEHSPRLILKTYERQLRLGTHNMSEIEDRPILQRSLSWDIPSRSTRLPI